MRDAVIVEAIRTPVGKRNGSLAGIHPADLSATILNALEERVQLDTNLVDDVLWGCVSQVGEQAGNIARYSALGAGWPESVPGTTIDRQCGSSQQAVHFAAAGVMSGQYDIAVAGGVESMTRVPMGSNRINGPGEPYGPRARDRYNGVPFSQGNGAELIADRWGLTREQLDQHALDSHARAAAAIDAGLFEDQIATIATIDQNGESRQFAVDEGVRRGGTLESLGGLKTVFREDGGRITAGNSSQISDGASALLITTSEIAESHGWRPLARLHSFAVVGSDPIAMLTGPIPATAAVLKRAGLTIDDIGVYEINEAFASVTLAWLAETGADPSRLNPNGGAIALGHPLGGSGARLMTTLVHHMTQNNIRYGLQSMCEGGGTANATILELLP